MILNYITTSFFNQAKDFLLKTIVNGERFLYNTYKDRVVEVSV